MRFFKRSKSLKVATTTIVGATLATCFAQPGHSKVIELLLSLDVSGSVDTSEYELERVGYFNAFSDPGVRTKILSNTGFAVAVQQWDTSPYPVSIDWIDLTQGGNYDSFLTSLSSMPRVGSGSTSPARAITSGIDLLTKNIFDGDVLIMDISGDGEENVLSNTAVAAARDSASAKGIVINGLPIGGAFVEDFYKNYVITSNGTLFPANSFADFDDAVKKKIEFEATGGGQLPPQPTSSVPGPLPILGIAAAFGSVRSMKKFSNHLKTYSMG